MAVRRRGLNDTLAALLRVSWMIGLATSTSMHGIAHNNSRSHDHGLGDAMTKTSSLGASENLTLNELKEVVMFLSQKIDDSNARIQSLEDKVRKQDATIKNLKTEVGHATSLHRYLQSDDSDCLPQLRNTAFGPRCIFGGTQSSSIFRFENRTIFNDDITVNEGIKFDEDAACMPRYNQTSRMCTLNNNFTFDGGDIIFDYNVRFDEDVRFNDDVRFRDTVRMESDVEFNNGGEVTFNKNTKFHENVFIKNEDHDIEFKLEDKVTARFYQDRSFKIDTHATFFQSMDIQKNLHIDGKLKVEKLTELDDLELYGYLWVDGDTRLDGELEANHHATIKSGLNVATGGLTVSREGAHISGTFNLDGQGNAKRNFNVDGRLTANTAVIDNTSSRRNLQTGVHDAPVVTPVFKVIGNADIQGELNADKIRSTDINFQNIDMDQIVTQVRIDLKNGDLIVGDVEIVNNFGQRETVLTKSRMLEVMDGIVLKVGSIIANSATINGKSIPSNPMSAAEIVRLLDNESLNLDSMIVNSAIIDGREYQHSDGNSLTSDDVLTMLEGKQLMVDSVITNTATIGGSLYTPPSSNGVDINDVVVQLGTHDGKVVIPKLTSYEIDVVEDRREISLGQRINPGPGSLELNGEEVVTKRETVRLQNRIEAIDDSMTVQQSGGMSSAEILQALEGTSLSVFSLETSGLTKSGTEVATMDDVGYMIGEAQIVADAAEAACTCTANDVEAVVTTDFVRGKVDESYVSSLGFVKESALSGHDFSSDCTCTASDVQNNIDQSFLKNLGVPFGALDCTCSTDFVADVIDSNYIKGVVDDLGVAYGDVEASCTCSSQDIENVVTYDYIADKGFIDNLSECSCNIQGSQITDVVDKGYIAGFGFLTTCPCGDSVSGGFGTDDSR
jgi:hypothetical protein